MTTPEIQRIDSDVFDPAGGDHAFVLGRNLAGTTEVRVGTALATSVAVWRDAPNFNGTSSRLASSVSTSTLYGTTSYSGWALVRLGKVTADSSTGYANQCIFTASPSAYWSLFVRSSGLIGIDHYDGLGAHISVSASVDLSQGGLHLIEWAFDQVALSIRVDRGTWVSTPATQIFSGAGTIVMGENYLPDRWLDAKVFEFATSALDLAASLDNVVGGINYDYGTTFGSIPAAAFSRASLNLTSLWQAGGYALSGGTGTWTGVASAGSSGGRDLTEATNPPTVASGVGLKLTVPANGAGKYPITIKNASGRTTLPNAVEMANPRTIPNCVWWLRPDAAVITQSGGLVTAWVDQSGSGDTNKSVSPSGTDKAAYNASDPTYNGKPTIGTFRLTGAYGLVSGAWSAPVSGPYSLGVIGHTMVGSTGAYFTYESGSQYNAFFSNSGTGGVYSLAASKVIYDPVGFSLESPRQNVVAVFNSTSSKFSIGARVVAGDLGTGVALGTAGVTVGSYFNTSATYGIERLAEVFAHSHALTNRELRTIRRYRDSYYGKAF
jgi:hypothetical protein